MSVKNEIAIVNKNGCIIVYEGENGTGVVNSYGSSKHIGIFSPDEAQDSVRKLAISHPNTRYVIASIEDIVSISQEKYRDLKNINTNWKNFGELYEIAGIGEKND